MCVFKNHAFIYSVRPKTWPLFKNMPPLLCVSCRSLIFVSGRCIYVQYTTAVLLCYVGKCGQDEVFHMAISITLRQKLCKKNTVRKNVIYSITNHDIDMEIPNSRKQ
jgi:hypothetical protein